jgi:tetratricopeptide (TPR) repeat protein
MPTLSVPALAAIDAYPAMRRQVAHAIDLQNHRIVERAINFIARPDVVAALDQKIAALGSGLLLLEGPSGAGATSLLCHLAATRGWPIWLADECAGAGLEALCAQLIARYDLPVALVPPAAARDALTLERLLAEAAERHTQDAPLVVLIDQLPSDVTSPNPVPFPAIIPPRVVVVHVHDPEQPRPHSGASLALPTGGTPLARNLIEVAVQQGCSPGLALTVVGKSGGSPLYVRLASGLLQTGVLRRFTLPETLEGLHESWWQVLDTAGRRLVTVLAAAGEPLPLPLWATLSGISVAAMERALERWRPLLEQVDGRVRLYHPSTAAAIARYAGSLAEAHAAFVRLAVKRTGGRFELLNPSDDDYLVRQLARHIALSDPESRSSLPLLIERSWVRAQERYSGTRRAAAQDAAWELRAVSGEGRIQPIARAAALAGTLAVLGRMLAPDAASDAFVTALQRGEPRELALRRARGLVDQLAPNRDKATVLRWLGEACHAHGMRAAAMRMLSEALDLEVPGLPRPWVDEREEALVSLARAAIGINAPDMALGVTTRITHAERRGLIETEVVRHLLVRGQLTRAEEVAHAIGHPHTHEWAMAEVAVGHARSGSTARAAEVLGTLKTETAVAWARGELACDAARRGQAGAVEQIATIPSQLLRDREQALVAQALVAGGQPAVALAAARQIADRDVRVRALIDLALLRPPNVSAVLSLAADDIAALAPEDRTPLVVALATAQGTVGDLEGALASAELLAAGEERDRAHSRVAAALARHGNHQAAIQLAEAIPDDDERYWTMHELARLRGEAGDWQSTQTLLEQIADPDEHARAEANLCIARARAGRAALAIEQAALISVPGERLRAFVAMADALVQQGATRRARAALHELTDPNARSRYGVALAVALASCGDIAGGYEVAQGIVRQLERSRALVGVSRAAVPHAPDVALRIFGQACRSASALGRAETFACLASSADIMAALGGAEVLLTAAHALDEVDSWWV